jgi:antitoxin VapB
VALYVKDPEVDRLAERLAVLGRVSKTEAVRRALMHELEREEAVPTLVDRGIAFACALRARGDAAAARPADKSFIDSLYGEA